MSNSSLLNLPYIMPAQAQKHVTHNEALRLLDVLVQLSVSNATQVAPPVSPQEGERFIIAGPATGEWENRENHIAAWQDGAWAYYEPKNGWIAFEQSGQRILVFNQEEWVSAIGDSDLVEQFGVNTSADPINRLSVKSDAVLFSHDDVTPGSGDIRHFINKSASNNTASYLFQSGFSARAEAGLVGDDNFHIKVSPDGTNWHEALNIDSGSGAVTLPNSSFGRRYFPSRGANSEIGLASHDIGRETAINPMSPSWMIVYPIHIPVDFTLNQITFYVHQAGQDSIGLALYSAEPDSAPGALVQDFGTVDCSTAGLKTLTLNGPLPLSPGLYWVAALASSGTAKVRGNPFTRDFGIGVVAANNLVRTGGSFRINTSVHSISFWAPPASLAHLETRAGQLDPSVAMHCPAILLK